MLNKKFSITDCAVQIKNLVLAGAVPYVLYSNIMYFLLK